MCPHEQGPPLHPSGPRELNDHLTRHLRLTRDLRQRKASFYTGQRHLSWPDAEGFPTSISTLCSHSSSTFRSKGPSALSTV